MPSVQCEQVEPRFDGGPRLWRVQVRWSSDQVITRFGETLSQALSKLSVAVSQQERQEAQKVE